MAGRHRKRAEIIRPPAFLGRDVVGQRVVELPGGFLRLLAQRVKCRRDLRAGFIGVQLDIVADAVRREEPVHGAGSQQLAIDDVLQAAFAHRRTVRAPVCPRTDHRRCPGYRPRNSHVWKNGDQSISGTSSSKGWCSITRRPEKRRRVDDRRRPVDRRAPLARLGDGKHFLRGVAAFVFRAQLVVIIAGFLHERRLLVRVEQRADDSDRARRVQHVDDRLRVMLRDFHRRMRPAGRRAADEQRRRQPEPFHLARVVHHLIERRGDQAAQADDVHAMFLRLVENLFARAHDSQVDDLEVVAREHHAHDVLADVVDVALDRRHEHLALRALLIERAAELSRPP